MSDVINVEDIGELHDLIETEPHLVVKFTAPERCAPCRAFAPHYEIASTNSVVTFASVHVDNTPDAAVEYGVMGIPTVKEFRDGAYTRDLKARTAISLLNEL